MSYLAISGLMLASSGIAYWTGERDAFLSPAEMSALDMHRWSAKWFLGVALLSLCLTAFMLYYPKFMPRFSRFLIFFFALAQLGVAIWAGHLGGRLVFG